MKKKKDKVKKNGHKRWKEIWTLMGGTSYVEVLMVWYHGMLIAWFPWRWGYYSRLQIPQNMMTSGLLMWRRCDGEKGPRQIDPHIGIMAKTPKPIWCWGFYHDNRFWGFCHDPNVGVKSPWERKGRVTRKGGGWRDAAVAAISTTFVLLLQGRVIVLDFDGAAWQALSEKL
jgi:hypothetical protein